MIDKRDVEPGLHNSHQINSKYQALLFAPCDHRGVAPISALR
eukprot:COSAG02_NODE_45658_length_355_cov_0.785156_1_plen_41_part_10